MATLHDTALGSNDAAGTSLATADALTVTAGDLIVVLFKHEGASDTWANGDCTDGTNSYTIANTAVHHTNTDLGSVTFYATAAGTGSITPAVASASRPYRWIKAYSFTPAASTTLQIGNIAAAQGASDSGTGAMSAGSASATAAGCAVVAFAQYASFPFTSVGSGWSEATEFSTQGSASLKSEYRLQSGAGSLTGDALAGAGSLDYIAQMVIFNESGGGSPITDGPKLVSVRSNIRFN
jgi:hypothetical protein